MMTILPPFEAPRSLARNPDGLVLERNTSLNTELKRIDALRGVTTTDAEKNSVALSIQEETQWGNSLTLCASAKYIVRKLLVLPNREIAMRRHLHRRKCLVVVSGIARVRTGGNAFLLRESESINIQFADWHSVENLGSSALALIEIQHGNIALKQDVEFFSATDKPGQ